MEDNMASTTPKQRTSGRVPKPTKEAIMEKQRKLKVARSTACGKVTGKTNEIQALVKSDNATIEVLKGKIIEWDEALTVLKSAHNLYTETLNQAECQHDAETWAAPIFNGFNAAKQEMQRQLWHLGQKLDKEDIEPSDSASQMSLPSSTVSRSYSRTSRLSASSSIVLARADAAAKKAELLARATALRKKKALQERIERIDQEKKEQERKRREEEMRLERQREEDERKRRDAEEMLRHEEESLEVQVELAAAEARLRVLNELKEEDLVHEVDGMTFHEQKHEEDAELAATERRLHPSPEPQRKSPDDQFVHRQPSTLNFKPNYQPHQPTSDVSSLAKLFIDAQVKSSLPQREIPVFDGNPFDYSAWLSAFNYSVDERCDNARDKLYYLEQFTSGEVNRVVRSHMRKEPEKGYKEAKESIASRYGNRFQLANAFLKKAQAFPEVKSEDVTAMNDLSLFLLECQNTMESLHYMSELNHTYNIRMLVSKLPYKLRERWRSITSDIQEEQQRMVKFGDLVKFVTKQARIATNPIYGDIKDVKTAESSRRGNHPSSRAATRKAFASTAEARNGELTRPSIKNSARACMFCDKNDHALEGCPKLQKLPISERLSYIKNKGLCFGCLKRASHIRKDCRCKIKCTVCPHLHPTVLHEDRPTVRRSSNESTDAKAKTTCGVTGAGNYEYCCRPTIIPVKVRAKDSDITVTTYAFLDDGSNAVFCSEELRRQLRTAGKKTKLAVETINQTNTIDSVRLQHLEVMNISGQNPLPLPEVFSHHKIPATKEDIVRPDDLFHWPYLEEVSVPDIIHDANVGLLIGNNIPKAMEPLKVVNSQGDGPYAYKTLLGWVVHGVPTNRARPASVHRIVAKSTIEDQLTLMYNHEFSESLIHDRPEQSSEDQRFMELMAQSIEMTNGQYVLPLPFRNADVQFPDNRPMAEQRLAHLRRKSLKNPAFKEEYVESMEKTISNGYAEVAPVNKHTSRRWYIPHHSIYHPQKQKIRVVFDCAAKYQGISLNKELMQGPDLTNTLLGVLLRFRQEAVPLMADIEAMFNQVKVPDHDRDALRFLWWPNGDLDKQAKEYRMTTHLFGATSSPSCVNYALKQAANDNKGRYGNDVIDTINHNFYVDDCLKSVPTVTEAIKLVKDLTGLCKDGGFRLTKWVSSSSTVMESIPEENRAKDAKQLQLKGDVPATERALGLLWSVDRDKFTFNINLKERPLTRRGILSTVSSIYDPLGMVSPVILPGKIIMQDLCRLKLGWDDEIPVEQATQWKSWISTIPELSDFSVSRCIKPTSFGEYDTQVHHFSDASEKGYGTATYLRQINKEGHVHCALLLSKSRVAPLKQITIPRMELTAATVAVKVDAMLRRELKIDTVRSFFWTDSTSVLRYINNETSRFHTFVANRIAIIKAGSERDQWRYVPTALNPADECSRGQSVRKFLGNERWTHGPEFLYTDEDEWPTANLEEITTCLNVDPEVKKMNVTAISLSEVVDEANSRVDDGEMSTVEVVMNASVVTEDSIDKLLNRYHCWHDLKKAFGWILKAKKMLLQRCKLRRRKKKVVDRDDDDVDGEENDDGARDEVEVQTHVTEKLTTVDMREAEEAVIKYIQRTEFREELEALEGSHDQSIDAHPVIKRSSPLYRLDPKLDGDGVLRVGGRLSRSAMPEESKHQYILPKKHHVTHLILQEIHKIKGHVGRNYMLAEFHKRFWATGANSTSRSVISQCVICRRQRGKVQQQKMANLPTDRVSPDEPPFTKVGVDYFGPFETKRGRSMVKRYGVIFTCMSTRAVHIEMADSLDTDSCLNAIRRFIARRGQVKEIRSDNGTNFVGANKVLKAEMDRWNQAQIHESLLQKNIKWTFNPPSASHFGGVWERQIRTIRKVMLSVINEQTLNDENLRTLFCEVEAIINGRPITTVSDDPNDLEALTPNHLLLMKTKPVLPPALSDSNDLYARRRWKQIQYLADLFWKRWLKEYLPQLQERQKWNKSIPNVREGDVVLIVDNTQPRGSWPMGRIVRTLPDEQGLVRIVEVKTKNGIFKRPICKLVMILEQDKLNNPVTFKTGARQQTSTSISPANKQVVTRAGRRIKKRQHLDL